MPFPPHLIREYAISTQFITAVVNFGHLVKAVSARISTVKLPIFHFRALGYKFPN